MNKLLLSFLRKAGVKVVKERIYKVGIYIRLSREDGDDRESESVENQRDIISEYVRERENFAIVDEYIDDGYTGTNFDRPSFKRLIEDIESGRIDTIITKDLSRFRVGTILIQGTTWKDIYLQRILGT